jgi:hypothetical protein
MSTPILHCEDDHRLVLEAPRTGSVLVGASAGLVLLAVWSMFPNYHIAQSIFALMALVGFTGLLHVHRLTLDLDARRWEYRDGWVWQGARGEGSLDDLGRIAIEENELMASRLRSRLLFLEFDRFGVEGREGRFPLGFAMGPKIAPERAQQLAKKLGVEVVDRVSEPPPEPESSRPATPPGE